MKFFEEFSVGERSELGTYTFTAEEIIAFARKWDPQPFHVDPEAARDSLFGGLCASGWHTACAWMKLYVAHNDRLRAERKAQGRAVPRFGASPGFRDLEWRRPVYAGETLSYISEIRALRLLLTRPGWGLVTARNTGVNQDGELAFAFTSNVLVEQLASDPGPIAESG